MGKKPTFDGKVVQTQFFKELGLQFFMILGGHIQCISEEISFIEFCITFTAIIGKYWLDYAVRFNQRCIIYCHKMWINKGCPVCFT